MTSREMSRKERERKKDTCDGSEYLDVEEYEELACKSAKG